jgi:hypothetical protein
MRPAWSVVKDSISPVVVDAPGPTFGSDRFTFSLPPGLTMVFVISADVVVSFGLRNPPVVSVAETTTSPLPTGAPAVVPPGMSW